MFARVCSRRQRGLVTFLVMAVGLAALAPAGLAWAMERLAVPAPTVVAPPAPAGAEAEGEEPAAAGPHGITVQVGLLGAPGEATFYDLLGVGPMQEDAFAFYLRAFPAAPGINAEEFVETWANPVITLERLPAALQPGGPAVVAPPTAPGGDTAEAEAMPPPGPAAPAPATPGGEVRYRLTPNVTFGRRPTTTIPKLPVRGDRMTYDATAGLTTILDPDEGTVQTSFAGARDKEAAELRPVGVLGGGVGWPEREFEFVWPQDRPQYYLEQVDQDLYRRVPLADKAGYTVTVRPSGPAGEPTVAVVLQKNTLTGGKYDDTIRAFVGRPVLVKTVVTTAVLLTRGERALLLWQPGSRAPDPTATTRLGFRHYGFEAEGGVRAYRTLRRPAELGGKVVDVDPGEAAGEPWGVAVLVTAGPPGAAEQLRCMKNVKQLCLAAHMYAAEHAATLPAAEGTTPPPVPPAKAEPTEGWVGVLRPYAQSPRFLQCPSQPDLPVGYAFNKVLLGHRLADIREPSETVMFFESDLGGQNPVGGLEALPAEPRHPNGLVVGFVDGHAEVVRLEKARQLLAKTPTQ